MKQTVLEKSTNTHVSNSDVKVVLKSEVMSTMVIDTEDEAMIVEHGHHRTVATEADTKRVIKITQQEFNPVLQAMQNAFD